MVISYDYDLVYSIVNLFNGNYYFPFLIHDIKARKYGEISWIILLHTNYVLIKIRYFKYQFPCLT